MAFRIAIINCSPPGSFFVREGKSYTASELLALKARDYGAANGRDIDARIYHPAKEGTDFPTLGDFDALIIPGSRLDIDPQGRKENPWMEDLIDLIRRAHEGGKPMLGICFGHQAIGVAFGCSIGRIPPPRNLELGMTPIELTEEGASDPLFAGVPPKFDAMMWHYRFVEQPPRGATVLAKGTTDGMIQAFRIGRTAWGVQFHPDYSAADVAGRVERQKAALAKETDLSAIKLGGERKDALVLDNFLRLALADGR